MIIISHLSFIKKYIGLITYFRRVFFNTIPNIRESIFFVVVYNHLIKWYNIRIIPCKNYMLNRWGYTMRIVCEVCGFTKEGSNQEESCPVCQNKNWVYEDLKLLKKISDDDNFIKAMLVLKENDPIEYQLKLNQFKLPLEQQQGNITQTVQQSAPKAKCPTCGSTNIQKISATRKVAGMIGFGLFSKTAKSQFECLDCRYKW